MSNLTITVPADVLKRARIRALEQGTSVNAILREHLEAFAGVDNVERARAALLELSESASSGSGPNGRRWSRDELHER